MRSYSAYDQPITVRCRALPSFLWLAAGFEVRVGQHLFKPGPGWPLIFGQAWTAFYFDRDGRRVTGLVRGVRSNWLHSRQRYSLVVGLSELARDTEPVQGWPLTWLAVGLLGALGLLVIALLAKTALLMLR